MAYRVESQIGDEADAGRRLEMLAQLNASNERLRHRRAQLGPNAHAVLSAIEDLSRNTPKIY